MGSEICEAASWAGQATDQTHEYAQRSEDKRYGHRVKIALEGTLHCSYSVSPWSAAPPSGSWDKLLLYLMAPLVTLELKMFQQRRLNLDPMILAYQTQCVQKVLRLE